MDGLKYEDGSRWTKDKCTVCDCKVSMGNEDKIVSSLLAAEYVLKNAWIIGEEKQQRTGFIQVWFDQS